MQYIKYLLVSLASALVAAYAALWLTAPSPLEKPTSITLPPLTIQQEGDDLKVWGSWRTVAGYEQPGANGIEIRCNQAQKTCHEAYASIFHHDTGADIEAQVFSYSVVEWSDTLLHAVAKGAMAECIDRNLFVSLNNKTASLEWMPQEGCEGDTGAAVLVGDPL